MMYTIDLLNKINIQSLKYFRGCFQNNPSVQDYVYKRIGRNTCNRFKLGYSPRKGLIEYLKNENVSIELMKYLGLVAEKQGDVYEIFYNRITMPIVHAGLLVGFGGRRTNASKIRYINTKKSCLYNKKEILYGLWKARKYIEEKKCAIVVEGYFDVLSMFSNDIKNTVGVCGTAFSSEHARSLLRWTSDIKILFDGDDAGIDAAEKARKIAAKEGLSSKIIKLKGVDPDEFLKSEGPKTLQKLLENS